MRLRLGASGAEKLCALGADASRPLLEHFTVHSFVPEILRKMRAGLALVVCRG